MDGPPLTLHVIKISPPSLISSYIPNNAPLPSSPRQLPSPPTGFSFSPTPNYPAPFGSLSLGSTLSLDLALENTHLNRQDVLGVKMMVEVQGPSGRYRLGEVIHSDPNQPIEDEGKTPKGDNDGVENSQTDESGEGKELPALRFGDSVPIHVESEMKEIGMNVVIVSVAWETLEGRRTMQRFLKYNVNPPLAIKTRIQTPSHPNTALSREKREDVYLEVLMQNVSSEGMNLSNVFLEAVQGLKSQSITRDNKPSKPNSAENPEKEQQNETLLPNDTRQYLFVLSPDRSASASPSQSNKDASQSVFPPSHPAGTILPLGRLDVSWVSGVYHIPGRLQTSTLNRRAPVSPIASTSTGGTASPRGTGMAMARALSAQSSSDPAPAGPLITPLKDRGSLLAPSPLHGKLQEDAEVSQWEFDLTLDGERQVEMEKTFKLAFKLGIRSSQPILDDQRQKGYTVGEGKKVGGEEGDDDDDDVPLSRRASRIQEHNLPPPPSPKIAIQYLTPVPPTTATTSSATGQPGPQVSVLPPSRTSTPLSPPPRAQGPSDKRAYTPLQQSALGSTSTLNQPSSRPGTPLSARLRQAQSQGLAPSANASVAGSAPGTPRFSSTLGAGDGVQSSRISVSAGASAAMETTSVPVVEFPPVPTFVQAHSQQTTASSKNPNSNSALPNTAVQTNQVIQIGNSLIHLPSKTLVKVSENTGPSYADEVVHKRWEASYEFELEFIAFDEGLAGLGGLRVLLLDDEEGQPHKGADEGQWNGTMSGYVAREWDNLGDLNIWG
ncbi:hypothetical protein IAT40_006465 [Kwoniella sp. CBS 6097]